MTLKEGQLSGLPEGSLNIKKGKQNSERMRCKDREVGSKIVSDVMQGELSPLLGPWVKESGKLQVLPSSIQKALLTP